MPIIVLAPLDAHWPKHHNGCMMLDTSLYDEISRLCQEFGLHTLYLFGSRAREVRDWLAAPAGSLQRSSSDIDVGVRPILPGQIDIRDKVSLAQALEALFQEQRIDLVLLDEADPFLAANIIRGVRLYTVDDYEADEYELYVLRRAADLAPFERARQAMILDAGGNTERHRGGRRGTERERGGTING